MWRGDMGDGVSGRVTWGRGRAVGLHGWGLTWEGRGQGRGHPLPISLGVNNDMVGFLNTCFV